MRLGIGYHCIEDVSITGGAFGIQLDSFANALVIGARMSGSSSAALDVSGWASLHNSLIIDNTGSGIVVGPSGWLEMSFTTVAGNTTGLDSLSSDVRVEHAILCGNGTDVSGIHCSTVLFNDICGIDCAGLGPRTVQAARETSVLTRGS